jgi:hypothetical protein
MSKVREAHVPRPSALTSAARWIRAENISFRGLEIHVYEGLGRHPRASVIVGAGRLRSGAPVGFVAEVLAGEGVLQAVLMDSNVAAQSHALAASIAQETGQALIDVMEQAVARLLTGAGQRPGSQRGRATSTQL